ncbi:MAG: TlpA family protein disulfide reductase [Acidimicrobiales bacterium]|nr:TlpA family protein disulfide reductase [Acidimicrobiales bacterium]
MNPKRLALIVSTLALLLIAIVAVISANSNSSNISSFSIGNGQGPSIGSLAPNFTLPIVDYQNTPKKSGNISLQSLKGQPVILSFFASWCTECRTELPLLASAAKTEKGRISILGIDSGDSLNSAISLLNQDHANFLVGSDPNQEVSGSLYALRGLPYSVFISKNGTVTAKYLGALTFSQLSSEITKMGGLPLKPQS